MKFSYKRLVDEHTKALKLRWGKDCLSKGSKTAINYGWSETDNSICSKIYQKSGHQVLDTWFDEEDRIYRSAQSDY